MTTTDTRDRWIPGLWGRSLRFVLVSEMIAVGGPVTVAELVEFLAEAGYTVGGRPSKVISDALRWEVARGRVQRLGRGVYCYRRAPRSTARRIRIFGARCRAWIDATRLGTTPPLTPDDPRRIPGWPRYDPLGPPWQNFGWLWVT